MREGDRGRRGDTEERQGRERERGKKRVKEAAIKQIWTCVRLVAVDTVSIAEGRGLHGETTLLLLLLPRHLIRRCAAFACIPLSESQAILASW